MDNNHSDLAARFPELSDPHATLFRVAEAFVAPEYARAGFALLRELLRIEGMPAHFGRATVLTAPHDFSNVVLTVGKWWLMNFHIAESEALEEGEDVEEISPDDYERALDEERDEEQGRDPLKDRIEDDDDDDDDDDDSELMEATFYQVGTFLLDSTVIPADAIFDREDIDCYAYDYPEERIAADRFYWARLVWEPSDLANVDLVNAIRASMDYVLTHFAEEMPFAEYHDADFAQLVMDEALCERAIAAADFGDVVVIGEGGGDDGGDDDDDDNDNDK